MENTNNHGFIRISDAVIADIAIRAAKDVEGVVSVNQGVWDSARNLISSNGKLIRGVHVVAADGALELTVQIAVRFGCKIPDVSAQVQESVTEAVADMTGFSIRAVNVSVVGVLPERESGKTKDGKKD